MEKIYYIVGFSFIWLSAITVGVFVTYYLFKTILDYLGEIFSILWNMLEYVYYRRSFKEWVKNKKRHPRAKQH
jgi:hypothetical protein